jgi:hypothetical protein
MRNTFNIIILTLLTQVLYSQKKVSGAYKTPWGSELILFPNQTYEYESFECYHLVTSKGTWVLKQDTLILDNNAGIDSIVDITMAKGDFDAISFRITDVNSYVPVTLPIIAYSKGDSTLMQTDDSGNAVFNLNYIDSIKISNRVIGIKANKLNQNKITLTFYNINIIDVESFEDLNFKVRRKKLLYIYKGKLDENRFFKRKRTSR